MRGRGVVTVGFCVGILQFCLGCGKEQPPPILPASGVVILGGKPLPTAQVRFIPQIGFGAGYIATATTDNQGRFRLQCNGQPGACAVENMVTVSEADIPPQLQGEGAQRELANYLRSLKNRPIPRNYASPATSPLRITVSEGQEEYKLELTR
jgi:hypothetical protein